jgi:energy-coupling factor transport system permease protein
MPFFIITVAINMFFSQQGSVVLFRIGTRNFTLEALLYAVILSLKLLLVIYTFELLGIMMDSDKAVSYFSSIIPKSTLIFMVALKLFPLMKRRISALKEVYSIRGIDFQSKSMKDKLKAFIPVLSVLLEDSLEKSFDIGEAVFVRGFLSSKRTVYDRQKIMRYDFVLIATSLVVLASYLILVLCGLNSIDFYNNNFFNIIFNKINLIILLLFLLVYAELIFINRKLMVRK